MGREYTGFKRELFFVVDGDRFDVLGELSIFELADFGVKYSSLAVDTPEGLTALGDIFDQALGPDEAPRFRKFCGRYNLTGERILQILMDLFEDVVGTPSERPSDSSDGPINTARTSTVISLSGGTVVQLPLTPEREAELRAAVEAAELESA